MVEGALSGWVEAFVVGLGLLLVLVLAGVPVSLSLIASAFIGLVLFYDRRVAFGSLETALYGVPKDFALVALPLYILMAEILRVSGVSKNLYASLSVFFGRSDAAIPLTAIGVGGLLGAMMGSSLASTTALSRMNAPEMLDRGYSKRLVAGVVGSAGGLAVIIPPSITAIIYAWVMDVPTIQLFAAGVLPGVLIATFESVYVLGLHWFGRLRKPTVMPESQSTSVAATPDLRTRLRAAFTLISSVGLVASVLGAMFLGLASVTESAAIGVLAAIVLGLFHGRVRLGTLAQAAMGTVRVVGFIFPLIVGGLYFSKFWSLAGVTAGFSEFVIDLPWPGHLILIACLLVTLYLGCIMDTTALLLTVVPLYASALSASYGFDLIWLGVIFLIVVEMALTTPPYGVVLFVVTRELKPFGVGYLDVVVGGLPFLASEVVVIALIIAFPELALWLPRHVG